MPGYLLHLAACKPESLKIESFRKGVEAPDLFKKWVSLYELEEVRKKYEDMRWSDMPDFSRFEERAQAKDGSQKLGMHFGNSNNADLNMFLDSLTEKEKEEPFWKGYLWHLITDRIIYTWLDIAGLKKEKKFQRELLHEDWDKLNGLVRVRYPEIWIPPEIKELNVIKFRADSKNLTYVDWNKISLAIDMLRLINPLDNKAEDLMKWSNIMLAFDDFKMMK